MVIILLWLLVLFMVGLVINHQLASNPREKPLMFGLLQSVWIMVEGHVSFASMWIFYFLDNITFCSSEKNMKQTPNTSWLTLVDLYWMLWLTFMTDVVKVAPWKGLWSEVRLSLFNSIMSFVKLSILGSSFEVNSHQHWLPAETVFQVTSRYAELQPIGIDE